MVKHFTLQLFTIFYELSLFPLYIEQLIIYFSINQYIGIINVISPHQVARVNNMHIKSKKIRVLLIVLSSLVVLIGSLGIYWTCSYDIANLAIKLVCAGDAESASKPEGYEEIVTNLSFDRDITYSSESSDCKLDIIRQEGLESNLPLVVYIHGGYYVGGDKSTAEPYCAYVANEGYVVANINYTLAPEAMFPQQHVQINDAIAYLVANAEDYNIDPNIIFIGGDSAGGHATSMMGSIYSNPDIAEALDITPAVSNSQIKGLLLLCGYFNIIGLRQMGFPLLNESIWMLTGRKDYENTEGINNYSTYMNLTTDYPATFITCGDQDPLINQALQMNDALEDSGIETISYFPTSGENKLGHEFQKNFSFAEAYIAMDMMLDFMTNQYE